MIEAVRLFVYLLLSIPLLLIIVMQSTASIYEHKMESELFRANLAAYQAVNLTTLKDQNTEKIDTDQARAVFEKSIEIFWNLDTNMNPTPTNKTISSRVIVDKFFIKDQDVTKTINGVVVNKNPAIVSRVTVPIKMPFLENLGEIQMPVTAVTIIPPSY